MKIAICIPAHGDVRAAFALSLSRMLIRTAAAAPSLVVDVMMGSGAIVALVREALLDDAESWGADAILWLDADQTFPPDTLLRLVSAREPVIGANYPRRGAGSKPTADVLDSSGQPVPLYTTRDKAAARAIEAVHRMGLGVCLTAMETLRGLPRPIFDDMREDHALMRKLHEAGYTPKVHHGLSAEVGHVGVHTWTNADSLAALEDRQERIALPAIGQAVSGKIGR